MKKRIVAFFGILIMLVTFMFGNMNDVSLWADDVPQAANVTGTEVVVDTDQGADTDNDQNTNTDTKDIEGTEAADSTEASGSEEVLQNPQLEEAVDEADTEKTVSDSIAQQAESEEQEMAVQAEENTDKRVIYFDNELSRLTETTDDGKTPAPIQCSTDNINWTNLTRVNANDEDCPTGDYVCTENLWKAEVDSTAANIWFRGYYYLYDTNKNQYMEEHYPHIYYTTDELTIPDDTDQNCFYGAPMVSQLSAVRNDASGKYPYQSKKYDKFCLGGHWGNVDEVNTIGDQSSMVTEDGTFEKDSTKYYGTASFYDYYSDYELWGKKLSDSGNLTYENIYQDQPLFSWNIGISNYYKNEATDNNGVYPLYFGGSRMLSGGDGSVTGDILRNQYLKNESPKITCGNGFADAAQNKMSNYDVNSFFPNMNLLNATTPISNSGNLLLKNSNKEVPYFNEAFLRGDNEAKVAYGAVYNNVSFPFTMSENGYWTYDSSTDNGLKLTKEPSGNSYYLKEQNGQVKYKNKAFFFPFNDTASYENERTSKLDYMFGMKLDIPFALDNNRQIQTKKGEDRDCVFTFSGDDDVWIFLEDDAGNKKLVLDLGGSHGAVAGAIDFKTGIVATSGKWGWDTENSENLGYDKANAYAMSKDTFIQFMESQSNSDQKEITDVNEAKNFIDDKFYSYINSTDKNENQKFSKYCNVTTLSQLLGSDSLKAYKNYKLKIYYMERGLDESNLRITFAFPTVKNVSVAKQWDDGIVENDHTEGVNVSLYAATSVDQNNLTATVTKADSNIIGGEPNTGETDASRKPDVTLNNDNKWEHTWKNLEYYQNGTTKTQEYYYFISELVVPAGYTVEYYDENGKKLDLYTLIVAKADGSTENIKGILADESSKVIIKNIRRGSITVKKKGDDGAALAGVTFSLTEAEISNSDGKEIWTPKAGTTVYSNTTDENGQVLFKDLIPGNYILTETSTVKGYSLLSEPVHVTIPFKKPADTEETSGSSNDSGSTPVVWGDSKYYFDLVYEVSNAKVLKLPASGMINHNSRNLLIGACVLTMAAICACGLRKKCK